MKNFPIENVKFKKPRLHGVDGAVSIEIGIVPFKLELDGYVELVDTSVLLDLINIPANLKALQGKRFEFPINPGPGYIEGSVYLFSAHNPVDVTSIEFGKITAGHLPLILQTRWLLEYEMAGFKNLEKTIVASIEI